MKSFLLALQFLTVAPVRYGEVTDSEISQSITYFPLVGFVLGWVLILLRSVFSFFGFLPLSIDIITVVALAALTGGLHLDGLSDACDGLFSGKGKEDMLKIMHDSHSGVMGVLGLVCILLLKIAFLFSVPIESKSRALLLMCVFSRWSMVFLMYKFPYARTQGKAKIFISKMEPFFVGMASGFTLFVSLFAAGFQGLFILFFAGCSVYLLGKWFYYKLGGITGDTVGTVNEIVEVLVLLLVAI